MLRDDVTKLLNEAKHIKAVEYRYSDFGYSGVKGPLTNKWFNDVLILSSRLPNTHPLKDEIVKLYNRNRDYTFDKMVAILESLLTDQTLDCDSNMCYSVEDDIGDFLKSKLRSAIFVTPEKEKQVQDTIEILMIGRGMCKGKDYDRETGKFNFAGKECIPDFIIPNQDLCIEVKLLRKGKKSEIIEQIKSDITAYGSKYSSQLFVVYDLGVIRDEDEFINDFETNGKNVKVIIVKE